MLATPFRHPAEPEKGGDRAAPDDGAKLASSPSILGTAALPRNFTLTDGERIHGVVQGLPAYVRRRRRIEDLEAELALAIARLDAGDTPDPGLLRAQIDARIEHLNRLITAHNRYYPIEANLPTDVRTGRTLELGEPWRPLEPATIDSLRARAQGA